MAETATVSKAEQWSETSKTYAQFAAKITSYMAEKALAHHSSLWSAEGDSSREIQFLDVAAGPGFFSRILAAKLQETGHTKYCISVTDYAQGMLDIAQQSMDDPNVKMFVMDGQDMSPVADSSMGGLNCLFGIMFMPQHQKCVDEMHRVLQPGARATVGTWLQAGALDLVDALGIFLGALEPGTPSSGAKFMMVGKTPEELRSYLLSAGFKDVTVVNESIELELEDMEQFFQAVMSNPIFQASVKSDREGAREPTLELLQEFLKTSPLSQPFRRPDGKPGFVVRNVCNMAIGIA